MIFFKGWRIGNVGPSYILLSNVIIQLITETQQQQKNPIILTQNKLEQLKSLSACNKLNNYKRQPSSSTCHQLPSASSSPQHGDPIHQLQGHQQTILHLKTDHSSLLCHFYWPKISPHRQIPMQEYNADCFKLPWSHIYRLGQASMAGSAELPCLLSQVQPSFCPSPTLELF